MPDLGEAFLRQYKVQDTADELYEMVDNNEANRKTARIYALALSGWLEHEMNGNNIVVKQAQGVGGAENFGKATETLNKLTEASEKWEADWLAYKLDLIYAYHQWGQLDGKKLETAKSQIEFLANPSNLGSQFKHELIDEPMRQKYLWLAEELK